MLLQRTEALPEGADWLCATKNAGAIPNSASKGCSLVLASLKRAAKP
jgi:hypothetical protein